MPLVVVHGDHRVLRRWLLHLRPLMIETLRPSGWPAFCGTMAGSRVQPASAPRRSGELHPSVGSLPSRPCDWVAALGRQRATVPMGVAANSGFDPALAG